MVGATAAVAEGMSSVATGVLGMGTSVTSAFSTFSVSSVASSLEISYELWEGVDLSELQITQRSATLVADDGQLLSIWSITREKFRRTKLVT